MHKAGKVCLVDSELYLYRIRNSSVMGIVNDKRYDGYKLMTELIHFFESSDSSFSSLYKKYGVARWVWATAWQSAIAASSYSEFDNYMNKFDLKKNMEILTSFPRMKVKYTAVVYSLHPKIYYLLINKVYSKIHRRKQITN